MTVLEIAYVAVNVIGLTAGVWNFQLLLVDRRALRGKTNGRWRLVVRPELRRASISAVTFIFLLTFAFAVTTGPGGDGGWSPRQVILIATLMLMSVLMTVNAVADVYAKRRLVAYLDERARRRQDGEQSSL